MLDMPYTDSMDLVCHAMHEQTEQKAWERWIHSMSEMSFLEYKEKLGLNNNANVSTHVEPQQSIGDVLSNIKDIFG